MRLTMRWYNVWHVAFNCLKRYRHKISPTINTTNHTINGIIYTESSFKMHSQYIWPLTTALTNVKQPNGAHVMFHRVWLRIIPTKKLRFTKKCTNIAVQQIWLAYLIELSSQADVFLFYLLNVLQSDETTKSVQFAVWPQDLWLYHGIYSCHMQCPLFLPATINTFTNLHLTVCEILR